MATTSSLPDFVTLHESVHFRTASDSKPTSLQHARQDPDLVLLLSWAGAPLRLVAKYTDAYAKLYPTSPVLLVQTEFGHILRHTRTSQDVPLEPVLSILQNRLHDQGAARPSGRLLVHLFSNGGSYKLLEIVKRYKARTGTCMPIGALVLDSAPGISTLMRSFKAISYALPKPWYLRWPLQVLLICFLVIQKTIERIVLGGGLLKTGRRMMNDPGLIDRRGKRCYIFGPGDELVGAQDVKDHAIDARARGYDATEEIFLTTPHVAHMRGDPARYWEIVKRTWASSNS